MFSVSVLLCFPPRNRWLPYKTLHITSFGGGFSAGHPQLVRLSRVMSMPCEWGHPVWHLHSAISVSLISGITENCLPLLLCPLTSCMTAQSNIFSDAKRKHITGLKKKKSYTSWNTEQQCPSLFSVQAVWRGSGRRSGWSRVAPPEAGGRGAASPGPLGQQAVQGQPLPRWWPTGPGAHFSAGPSRPSLHFSCAPPQSQG